MLTFIANNIDWLMIMNPRIPHHEVVMVPRTSIIFESEVSITALCLLCSPRYTAVWIKNCLKSTPVIKETTTMVLCTPAMFTQLHSSTNQELFEKYICNHYEKYDGAACPMYRLKLKYPLPFSVSYAQLVTQQYESRNVWKAPL